MAFQPAAGSHRTTGKEVCMDWKLILAVALIMGLKLAAVIAWIIRIC